MDLALEHDKSGDGSLLDSQSNWLMSGRVVIGTARLRGTIYPKDFGGHAESRALVTSQGWLRWGDGRLEEIRNVTWGNGSPPMSADFEFGHC
jgi:hypothetical protein